MTLLSDDDRAGAVARLRAGWSDGRISMDEFERRVACAYGARTRDDLVPLVDDLPVPAAPPPPAGQPRRWVVGVCSGARQGGRWRPARPTRAVAVLGSCRLDLCDADLRDGDVDIRAVAVLGGIEVLVPEGMGAELGGLAILGSKAYRVRGRSARADVPVAHVRVIALLGGVTVRTRPFTSARS